MLKKSNPLKFGAVLIVSVILTLGFSISLQSLLATWTGPTDNPPQNNIDDLLVGGSLSVTENAVVGGKSAFMGNVGVGILNPLYQLHVVGTGVYSEGGSFGVRGKGDTYGVYGQDDTVTDLSYGYLGYSAYGVYGQGETAGVFGQDKTTGDGARGYLGFGFYGVRGYGGTAGGYFYDTDNLTSSFLAYGNYGIYSAGNAYFGGNVGIGVTSPLEKLDVNGNIKGTKLCIGTDCRDTWPSGGIAGTGSAGHLTKWTAADVIGDSLIYDDGTNVGIGTTTPTSNLHVYGTGIGITSDGGTAGVRGFGTSFGVLGQDKTATDGSFGYLGRSGYGVFSYGNNAGGYFRDMDNLTTTDTYLAFGDYGIYTGNKAYFGGNVGIGTTTPTEKLDVDGNVKANSFIDAGNSGNYIDPNGTSYVSKIVVSGVPTLANEVATKNYVDNKIPAGVSLDGFVEVGYNYNEDTYGAETFTWSSPNDTCNSDNGSKFSCNPTDEKMCMDYWQTSQQVCSEGCWTETSTYYRNVVCKKGVILQKVYQANFTKTLNSTNLWDLYGREMYAGSTSIALTNATKICTTLYGLNYVSHTTTTHGTSCGGTYHVVTWNGSSFTWIGLGCGGNVTVLDSVSCKS